MPAELGKALLPLARELQPARLRVRLNGVEYALPEPLPRTPEIVRAPFPAEAWLPGANRLELITELDKGVV